MQELRKQRKHRNAAKKKDLEAAEKRIEELSANLLQEFVEKIVVHESEELDEKRWGKLRRQEIGIYYSFVGKVELSDT